MRRLIPILLAVATAATWSADGAGAATRAEQLDAARVVIHADDGTVALKLHCYARAASCAGTLRVQTIGKQAITPVRRGLRLRPDHDVWIVLPLLRAGLRALGDDGPDHEADVTLTSRTGSLLSPGLPEVQTSCRSGQTLATSPALRVFQIYGFGDYVCRRPAGRPMRMLEEDASGGSSEVELVRVAGAFVALAGRSGTKCGGGWVQLYDLGARRIVRTRATTNTYNDDANGCHGTTAVTDLLVRPSGALAWIEAAGDDGAVTVRALDTTGDHLLDHTSTIDPTSLTALDTTTITWHDATTVRTAPLP